MGRQRLLNIIRTVIPELPQDSRALKQTPREINCIPIAGGEYVYYGIKDALTDFCVHNSIANNDMHIIFRTYTTSSKLGGGKHRVAHQALAIVTAIAGEEEQVRNAIDDAVYREVE